MRDSNHPHQAQRAEHRATTRTAQTTRALGLFGAQLATFAETHPFCDQILQASEDAVGKGEPGPDGRRHCARHVASYTAGQTIATLVVTWTLGYRLPWRALIVGKAITAGTHYAIDRRAPFIRLMRSKWFKKAGYLDHATVQRKPGKVDESGPGTALMELDQAAHRLLGVIDALITTCIAVRAGER